MTSSNEISVSTQTEKKKIAICEKIMYTFNHISVEPILFLYILSCMISMMASQNLALQKACAVNLQFNDSICDALVKRNKSGYEPYHETEVQKLVTKWSAYKAIFTGSMPVILMIFLGSWSDRHLKRKPIILMPLIGDSLGMIGLFICSHYMLELPMEYSWFCETIFPAIFGGWNCIFMGVYSYVSGISTDEARTIRIGAVSMSFSVAMSLGMFLSGILLSHLGFQGIYSISLIMIVTAFLYGTFMIKESEKEKNKEEKKVGFLKDFIAFKHVKNTFNICFKEGPGNRRKRMLIIMLLGMLIMGPLHGEFTVLYMYNRLKFGWDEVDYSIFNSVQFCIQILGNSFSLTIFSKYFKIDDAMLGAIATISKMMGTIVYAFAPSGMYFYFGAVVEVFYGTSHIALRALMAKIVPPSELGQSNSVFGICESVMPLAFGPLYSTIYIKTMTIFPGTFFIISAGIHIVNLCLFMWLFRESKSEAKIRLENQESTELGKELLHQKYSIETTQSAEH